MKKLHLLKRTLLLFALIVGCVNYGWAEKTEKSGSYEFTTTGCSGWTTDNAGGYCGGYGRNKSGAYYVMNKTITNFSEVDFSKVNTPSVDITVKALTNSGTNTYTVSLVDKDGKVVGTPVTKNDGMGNGSNASSAKESTVTLIPVVGTTGYKIDFPAKSAITGTSYTLTYTEVDESSVATPTFLPDGGGVTKGTSVAISCITEGATIHYTTDGSNPTSESATYSSALTINEAQTIKAIAVKAGLSDSEVATAVFTIKADAPSFSIAEGIYDTTQSVELSCTTEGVTIYYTTDGSTPTTSSTTYTSAISVSTTSTIKAIAVKDGLTNSDVASATYTLKCKAPTFSVAEGDYDGTQSVELSCATADATIYYTTNGSAPTSSSTLYSGAITVSSSLTIKAIAVKSGLSDSDVAQAEYSIVPPTSLPFTFNSGKGSLPTSMTQSGLGNDYASAPKLKFDGTGDYLILKFKKAPSSLKLMFDIKGNSFSGGTFKVQYSADGSNYTDLETYTNSNVNNDEAQTETFSTIPTTTRYIKWVYTNKGSGNIGLGNIKLYGYASVTISASGWTSLASAYDLDYSGAEEQESVPVVAYAISSIKKTSVTLTQHDAAPAGVGMILKGNPGSTYSIPVTTSVVSFDNELSAAVNATAVEANSVYAVSGGKLKLFTGTEVPAGKAYLLASKVPAEAHGLTLDFDEDGETTGIAEISSKKGLLDGDFYDLSGRKVAQPTKGLYIMNGKKVIIK